MPYSHSSDKLTEILRLKMFELELTRSKLAVAVRSPGVESSLVTDSESVSVATDHHGHHDSLQEK